MVPKNGGSYPYIHYDDSGGHEPWTEEGINYLSTINNMIITMK